MEELFSRYWSTDYGTEAFERLTESGSKREFDSTLQKELESLLSRARECRLENSEREKGAKENADRIL